MTRLILDLLGRGLIVLIFVSGSAVLSFLVTRLLSHLIPHPFIGAVFLGSGTVVLTAITMLGVSYLYVYRGFGTQADIIRRRPGVGSRVVITFDDGPSEFFTPALLEILKEKGAPAVFFMVGSQVEKYPAIARRVVEEGHELGNHTYSHITVPHAPPAQLTSQVIRTNLSIFQHTGRYPQYLRPPRGLYDTRLRRLAGLMGQHLVLWSLSSLDWHPRSRPEAMVRRLVRLASPGDILLFHDSGSLLKNEGADRRSTVEALPGIIDGIREKGFEIVSLEEYLAYTGKRLRARY